MSAVKTGNRPGGAVRAQANPEADSAPGQAWESLGAGVYVPYRVRGSFRGASLG